MLAGQTLGEVASACGEAVPVTLARHKGWVGQILEKSLGATAGSRAEPDFPELGIELKSLPVDAHGNPTETTFVCSLELPELERSEWAESRLLKKLSRVLWVPVLAESSLPLGERAVGTAVLWSPDADETALLRQDWETLVETIALGRTGELTGRIGEVLQVRPKAARGASRRRTMDEDGALYDEQPKGFYLRKAFTRAILQKGLRG